VTKVQEDRQTNDRLKLVKDHVSFGYSIQLKPANSKTHLNRTLLRAIRNS
jgi:hypothetical protein